MSRLDRDLMYLTMADLMSQRATCLRGQVGVILVQDRRPVGGGYNGAPKGQPHCLDVGCEPLVNPHIAKLEDIQESLDAYGCQRAVHAEANAIAWAARHGVSLAGAEMYCVYAPCKSCAQLVVAAGVTRYIYRKPYRAERLDLLRAAGIEVVKYDG